MAVKVVADIAAKKAKFFTVLDVDARKGYHQCLLDEEKVNH